MFWNKKKKTQIPKQALILHTYLAGCPVFLGGRAISPAEKAGIQVFILGMTDKLRQVENFSWEEFLDVYRTVLSQFKILPSKPIAEFVDLIGNIASADKIVSEAMVMGAESITMYVSKGDANAPMDMLSVLTYAEDFEDRFKQIA